MTLAPDNATIVPALAKSWEVSPDATVFTIHLDPSATFSDGSPVTGDDVKWSLERLKNIKGGAAYLMDGLKSIDVKDPQTEKVTNWALEMGAPAVIQRNGWTRNSMKIGDIVVVDGTKAKNGKPLANARTVVMQSTGKKLGAGSSEGVTP